MILMIVGIVAVMLSAFITLVVKALKPLLQTKDMGYTHPQCGCGYGSVCNNDITLYLYGL